MCITHELNLISQGCLGSLKSGSGARARPSEKWIVDLYTQDSIFGPKFKDF